MCAGYDSVVGREGQRGVDEWVFFRQDQLLPCFLVDEPLGLVMASATQEDPVRHSQVQRKTKSTQASSGVVEHHFYFDLWAVRWNRGCGCL